MSFVHVICLSVRSFVMSALWDQAQVTGQNAPVLRDPTVHVQLHPETGITALFERRSASNCQALVSRALRIYSLFRGVSVRGQKGRYVCRYSPEGMMGGLSTLWTNRERAQKIWRDSDVPHC